MASDLTPEELAELRTWYGMATDRGDAKVSRHQAQAELWNLLTCEGWQRPTAQIRIGEGVLPKLLDMAERCADYDRRLGAVMPADFKDWHDNLPREWPEVAAGTITNLRGRPAIELTNDERDAMKAPGVYAIDGRIVGVVDATATPVGRMVRMSAKPAGIKP